MTTELTFLMASAVLGLVHIIAASHLISWQRGYRWTAGNREDEVPPLRGAANRVDLSSNDGATGAVWTYCRHIDT
jgi:hypothetical protein